MSRLLYAHYVFSVLYGVVAMLIIFVPVALVEVEIVFQFALVAFSLIPGTMIFMSRVDERGTMKHHKRVKLCCALLIADIALIYAIINPAIIVFTECPDLSPHRHHVDTVSTNGGVGGDSTPYSTRGTHGPGDVITSHHNNTIDILVKYLVHSDATGIPEEHALMLKYNNTSKRIERRVWRPDKKSWRTTVSTQMAIKSDPLCTQQHYSRFHFMEEEITEAVDERRLSMESQQSIRIVSHDSNNGQTTVEEDAFDMHRKVRRMCRNEYEFMIVYMVFIATFALIQFIAFLFYVHTVQSRYSAPKVPAESLLVNIVDK